MSNIKKREIYKIYLDGIKRLSQEWEKLKKYLHVFDEEKLNIGNDENPEYVEVISVFPYWFLRAPISEEWECEWYYRFKNKIKDLKYDSNKIFNELYPDRDSGDLVFKVKENNQEKFVFCNLGSMIYRRKDLNNSKNHKYRNWFCGFSMLTWLLSILGGRYKN